MPNQTHSNPTATYDSIKLGIDAHAKWYYVARQIDGATPQPVQGKYTESARYYRAAAQVVPDSIEARLGYLLPLLAQGNAKGAASAARQIVAVDPGNYYGNLRLAVALRMQKRIGEARAVVAKMLEAYPADVLFKAEMSALGALRNQGRAKPPRLSSSEIQIRDSLLLAAQHERNQRYDDAIRVVTEQYTQHPESYALSLRLGWLYYCQGQYADAASAYLAAIKAAPTCCEARLGYLLVLLAQGKYDEAESVAGEVLARDPGNYYANLRLAVAFRLGGKLSEAQTVIERMLRAYPADVLFLSELAALRVAQNKRPAAQRVASYILALDPDSALARQLVAEDPSRHAETRPR